MRPRWSVVGMTTGPHMTTVVTFTMEPGADEACAPATTYGAPRTDRTRVAYTLGEDVGTAGSSWFGSF